MKITYPFAHELLELLDGRLQRLCELSAFKPLDQLRHKLGVGVKVKVVVQHPML